MDSPKTILTPATGSWQTSSQPNGDAVIRFDQHRPGALRTNRPTRSRTREPEAILATMTVLGLALVAAAVYAFRWELLAFVDWIRSPEPWWRA